MTYLNNFGLVFVVTVLAAVCNGQDVADSECPATGLVYFPHYANCTLFYQCNEGEKTLMECPDGYAWSIVINACREKSLVDCGYTTIAPPNNNNTEQCPDNGLTYLPHYGDCTKYIQCFMGNETVMNCSSGFAWSITLAACDLKQNVDCSYTTLSPPTSPIPVTNSTPVPSPEFQCPQSNGISYHPHPYDCSMFYQCIAGVLYTLQCPMGYFFSIVLQRCELQSSVDCSYTSVGPNVTTPALPTTVTPNVTISTLPTTVTPNVTISTLPTTVTPNVTILTPSTTTPNITIPTLPTTTLPTAAPTTPTTTTSAPTQQPGNRCTGLATGTFLPHPTDCSKFIECVHGAAIEFSCPAHTTWNQELLTCDSNPNNCK